MDISQLFWNSSIEDICKGYKFNEDSSEYICLICGEKFIKGIIYPEEHVLMDAELAVKTHIHKEHNSVFNYLLSLDKKYTGLSDIQSNLLDYFYKGYSDKEIIEIEGDGSPSTIRNHRFKFKEKEKQAKIFICLMNLLSNKDTKHDNFININRRATMVDDRYVTTEEESEKIIKNFIKDDKLINFPSSEKKKIVILKYLSKKFASKKMYTEKEVNEIIKNFYIDFATLRRYLIQYGFMGRKDDCSSYWVNE